MSARSGDNSATTSGQPALLLGTVDALEQLAGMLTLADAGLQPVGCVVAPAPPDGDVGAGNCAILSRTGAVADSGRLAGLPIYGQPDMLEQVIAHQRIKVVLISVPLALVDSLRQVTQRLEQMDVSWRFIPTLTDQFAGRTWSGWSGAQASAAAAPSAPAKPPTIALKTPLWSIDPAELLDRQPQPLDEPAIQGVLADKVVLVTGAGGSIGSELARIVGRFGPAKLILVERAENALFEIDREMARRFPALPRAAVLHDVSDAARTLALALAHRPNVIFHAAAHKHVPMMEDHPAQAIENNFYGTRSIADAAHKVHADRFVMISTDKAVRPSSVMGASKRLAELYIQYLTRRSETVFSMVRFGNVLGSACSVLPIWSEQLARGGPITVTHQDMHRYFMTIPEAAGLVLQSAAFAGSTGGGEVFLLNMGKPIRILDLAQRFIRHHGLTPDSDVKIDFTGIRPGEKLFEELAYDSEEMMSTPHPSVRMWKTGQPESMRMRHIIAAFDRLRGAHHWQDAGKEEILAALHSAVPEMVAPAAAPSLDSIVTPPLAAAG